jgi:DNA segregation ATPase FtsK/SpoIIIE, S-DNA-T family
MILGKTESKKAKPRPTFSLAQPPVNKAWREVWRLIWIALAAQTIASLMSFSPTDPSWSTWSSQAQFKNWVGRAGSIQADLLLQVFGLPAFALGLLIFRFALRKVGNYGDGAKRALLIPVAFLLSLCSLVQTALPAAWVPWKLVNAGGLAGQLFQTALVYALGNLGAVVASILLLLASTILLFEWPVLSWLVDKVKQAFEALCENHEAWVASRKKTAEAIKPPVISAAGLAAAEQLRAALPAPRPQRVVSPSKDDDEDDEASSLIIESGLPNAVNELPDFVSFEVKKPKSAPPPPKPVSRDPNRVYELPPASLLTRKSGKNAKPIDRTWFLEKGQILVEKLKDFGVEGEIVNISPGPVITVYEFKPASGVKIKDIANLSDDLTLALSVLSVRIVAPIPGKPVVGIEIPSPEQQTVHFRDLMEETPFYDPKIRIPLLIGRLASGEPVVADLASMPHLLVAGATGTGKSVFINSLISSLLYRYTPNELRLILVDPKMVELSSYEGIPHLLLPVVVDSKKAVQALRWAVDEMERRYSLLHEAGERHINTYNERILKEPPEDGEEARETLPYIVVIIDEYADLMAVVPKEVEMSITRLAQKARASGIHLVLATQRPSTDVVTGLIKANFPSRLSFRVASSVDSKTILDRTGAERLLGNGDMLLQSAGFAMLRRMQGAFISDDDTEKVVDFLKSQGEPEYDERILMRIEQEELGESGDSSDSGDGEGRLYDQAVRLVVEKGEASISLIQRHLKIGYNRAATLIEEMEKEGVVGPASGAGKRRPVLVGSI